MSVMKVEFSIYGSNLKNVAGAFKGTSDPYAVVTQVATEPGKVPVVLGKTEVVKNSLSPHWVKVFHVDYQLGAHTKLAVNLYDEVRKGQHHPMGAALFDIGELLGARGNTQAKKLKQGGTIFATVRKSAGSGLLRLQVKGDKLKNVEGGLFGKSDPFFEISRKVDAAGSLTWNQVYRSAFIKNNLNPGWEMATLELSLLCGGDLNAPIKFGVFDYEHTGKHVSMGEFQTTVNDLVKKSGSSDGFKLITPLKNKEVGTMLIVKAEVAGIEQQSNAVTQVTQGLGATTLSAPSAPPAPSTLYRPSAPYTPSSGAPPPPGAVYSSQTPNFIDYVTGGCELNVVVAIDFTGSNGDPRQPGTLHHISRNNNYGGGTDRNPYEKAIAAIVSILAQYDSDQSFPVLGFGAKYSGVVRHCFQCGPMPEVKGVAGVLEAYHQVFSSGLVMSGPTVFTEVIDTAAGRATQSLQRAQATGKQSYTILLILTDGAVSDVNATVAALERASQAPLSIVIVGVGNADFSEMQFLDDAAASGMRKFRDITQFVSFNRHANSSVSLTRETLQEIPNQLVEFFQSRRIQPLPPVMRSEMSMANLAASTQATEDEEIDLTLNFKSDNEIVVASGGQGFVDGFNAGQRP